MNKWVKVIVDISITELNKGFDYKLPPRLQNKIKIGQIVKVPFGKRKLMGFVIDFPEKPSVNKEKVKNIVNLVRNEVFFDEKMLNLFKWIAAYYQAPLARVIHTALPTGVLKGKINKKTRYYLVPAQSREKTKQIIKKIAKRAPKQSKALQVLLNNSEQKLNTTKLAEKADCYQGAVRKLKEKGFIKEKQEITKRRPYINKNRKTTTNFTPTPDQKKAIDSITKTLDAEKAETFLLHGVTGSGKTEVYLQLIERCLAQDKGAIVLVPEISLAPVMVRRIYSRFGNDIAILHSNLSLGERYDEWRRLKNGEASIAIGARSAIFAPLKNPGIIIIDEEHENSYKQNSTPYYHARKVARKRSRLESIPLVLGSATPSLSSYYFAQNNKFNYLSLPKRVKSQPLPPVETIDMREELEKGNMSILSKRLFESIKKTVEKNKQVLLFLNRRGYSNFVLCRECGEVITCQNCDISLTYHAQQNLLKCHYCDYSQKVPKTCPDCGSQYIKKFGIGTEKIEEEVQKLFPEATVDRMDVDTTSHKGAHHQILNRLEKGKTDILVGTQMIAKGHDYPNISLVGVITADTMLNLPDFRSSERTFQLLTQVAGRTGRGEYRGRVVIQTYTPEHYSIKYAQDHDYQSFFQKEIILRQKLGYPPFTKLANIIISGQNQNKVIELAGNMGQFLDNYSEEIIEILGPSPAPLEKIRNKFRWQLILKFDKFRNRIFVLKELNKKFTQHKSNKINFIIDVDPLTML